MKNQQHQVIYSILKEDIDAFKLAIETAGLKAFKLKGSLPLSEVFDEYRIEYGHPRSLILLGKSLETHKARLEHQKEREEHQKDIQSTLQELKSLIKS